MTAYIRLYDGKYPLHEGVACNEYGSLDAALSNPDGFRLVEMTTRPDHNKETQVCFEGAPVLIDGVWKCAWVVSNMTEGEILERQKLRDLQADPVAWMRFITGQSEPLNQNLNAPGGQPNVIG